jgi:hypothetical protein
MHIYMLDAWKKDELEKGKHGAQTHRQGRVITAVANAGCPNALVLYGTLYAGSPA